MPIAVTLTILDSTDIISIKTIASKIMQYVFLNTCYFAFRHNYAFKIIDEIWLDACSR